jgi:hypothetical protein
MADFIKEISFFEKSQHKIEKYRALPIVELLVQKSCSTA